MDECPFCEIVATNRKRILFEGEHVFATLSNPRLMPGHVLIIPKRHVHNLDMKAVGDALAERPGGTTTVMAWQDQQNHHQTLNFAIKWIAKDLKYTREFAETISTPLLDDVLKKYEKALSDGRGEENWTVVNTI